MDSFALAVPVLPDRTSQVREYVAAMEGPWREEEERFHREAGSHREAMWLQPTPHGDLFLIYWEGEDVDRFNEAFGRLLTSDEPYGTWLREQFADLFGVDVTAGRPPRPEPLRDLRLG